MESIRAALLMATFVFVNACGGVLMDDETNESGGPRGVCERLRAAGADIEEWTTESGYSCRTKAEGNTITVTAFSSPSFANALEAVWLEGSYVRGRSEAAMKRQMMGVASTLFARLYIDVPPGIGVAIQTQSRSEVEAGKLRVDVDHHCETAVAGIDTACRIAVHVRNAGPHSRSQQARFLP
jgi:hypothetical protein